MWLQLGQVFSVNFSSNNGKELLQSQFISEQPCIFNLLLKNYLNWIRILVDILGHKKCRRKLAPYSLYLCRGKEIIDYYVRWSGLVS